MAQGSITLQKDRIIGNSKRKSIFTLLFLSLFSLLFIHSNSKSALFITYYSFLSLHWIDFTSTKSHSPPLNSLFFFAQLVSWDNKTFVLKLPFYYLQIEQVEHLWIFFSTRYSVPVLVHTKFKFMTKSSTLRIKHSPNKIDFIFRDRTRNIWLRHLPALLLDVTYDFIIFILNYFHANSQQIDLRVIG